MSDDDIAALALDTIRRPVSYDSEGQRVRDREGETALDVRGWGRIGYYANGGARQDAIGEWLVGLINAAKVP